MTSPPEQITIVCPECRADYRTWWRPSMNLSLDNFSRKYVRKMSSATCPICQTVVDLTALVVRTDGRWQAS